jgi:hypothetical protein
VTAGTSELIFIKLDISGVESIEKEIENLIKMISGTTGVPVHYLGFVDLMSNRSTAETLIEMVNAATNKERKTWIGAYEETISKAMVMWNEAAEKGMSKEKQLDPSKIQVDIPIITKEHYERIEKIFLPATIAGKLSDEFFLSQIPGLDVKAEMERKEAKEEGELEQAKRDLKDKEDEALEDNLNQGNQGGQGQQQ